MMMLPTVWTLRDVADVEALCRGVIAEVAGPQGLARLEPCDYEDSLAFLLAEAVVLNERYDSTRVGIVFRPWLYQRLRWALVDEWRRTFGRHGEKRIPDTRLREQRLRDAGIDDPGGPGAGDADPGADRLDVALIPRPGDHEADRLAVILGLDPGRARTALREIARLDHRAAQGAPPGDPRAARNGRVA